MNAHNTPFNRRLFLSTLALAGLSAPWHGLQAATPGKVLVVGDSLSAEYGLARGSGWVALMQQQLQADKISASIHNASISGDTSAGGRARLPGLLQQHKPAVVVIVYVDPQQCEDQSHTDIDSILHLTEISGAGVAVDFDGNLIDAGKRVENVHVVLGLAHHFFRQNIEVFETDIILFVKETLALDAGHIQDIKPGNDVFQFDELSVGNFILFQFFDDIIRNTQFIGRDEHKADTLIAGHGGDQGVYGAAEFEVAAQTDGHVVETSLQGTDGEQIGQRLRGMLVAAVAAVDDRNAGDLFGHHGRALFGMADRSDVRKAGDRPDGVRYALALGHGGTGCIGEAHDASSQVEHGSLRAEPGTC